MKVVTWQGRHDIQVKDVPDPKIQDPRDIILLVTTTAICGSDLHLFPRWKKMMSWAMNSWASSRKPGQIIL